ncbi:MAG: EamA family transporter [Pseudomonadota bacterium]|nr:EamA family transporter [Pseudomonadota bacterium]
MVETLLGEYLYTIGAVVLWAASTPVISYALEGCRRTSGSFFAVVVGLNVALATGFIVLTMIRGLPTLSLFLDIDILIAGLLTFPIGTGLYYVTSILNQDRAALAAQFANVKPILTISAGVLLFAEVLDWAAIFAVALILFGILLMFRSALRAARSLKPLVYGLLLAAAWGIGEIFVKFASFDIARFDVAHASLGASIPITVICSIGLLLSRRVPSSNAIPLPVLGAFALHGLFSFAGAYVFYFASIAEIGLANTALAVAFWPLLGLVFASFFKPRVLSSVPSSSLFAMGIFLAGALLHVGF